MIKTTDYKGARIKYSIKGKSKRTVVLIHGFLENHKVWDNNELEFISLFKLEDIIKS